MADKTKSPTPEEPLKIVPDISGDTATGEGAPAVADKTAPAVEEKQATDTAANVTVYSMDAIREQRAAAAKEPEAGAPAQEDTRQEWEKSTAELDAEKQAEKRRGRPPKADKDKAVKPEKPQKQAKADKAPKQASTPKVEKSKEPKPATKEAAAPPEPSLEEKKQKLEAELREKYGIAKTDKPVEPWVAPEVEQVVRLPHEKLHAFKDHPFNVEKNPKFLAFVASIRAQGVTQPVIVRPDGKDGYEIISGHRRDAGSIEAGVPFTPCIIRALNDEQAIQQMVEDNVNNREISTMELARALKMQLESIKHQGAREALSGQDFTADVDKRSNEVITLRILAGRGCQWYNIGKVGSSIP